MKKGYQFHNRATGMTGTVTATGKTAQGISIIYYRWDITGSTHSDTEESFRKIMRLRPTPKPGPTASPTAQHVRKGRQVVNPYVKGGNNA